MYYIIRYFGVRANLFILESKYNTVIIIIIYFR